MRDICRTRGDTYLCLSRCLGYPDERIVGAAGASLIVTTLGSLGRLEGLKDLAEEIGRFGEELIWHAGEGNGQPISLQVEYNRLFAGPLNPQAYASEMAFLSQSGWRAENCRQLAEAYLGEGLKLAPGSHEQPDHISIELEFMAHLCGKELLARENNESEALATCERQERSFLENHLAHWAPAFLATVERAAVVGFYRSLARIGRVFVVWDYEHVESSERKSDERRRSWKG